MIEVSKDRGLRDCYRGYLDQISRRNLAGLHKCHRPEQHLFAGLFQLLHFDGFDPGITYIQDIKLVIINNDSFFQVGNCFMVVDDIAGKGF